MSNRSCYHCNEPVPAGENRRLVVEGEAVAFCCAGCEAVTRLILDAGLDDFYRFRTEAAAKVDDVDASRWIGFDAEPVLDAYASAADDGVRELRLQLDNLRCAACGWLVEQTLENREGVSEIRLNPVTGRARLCWRQEQVKLSSLLAALDALGFKPHPLRPDEQVSRGDAERKTFLKRLAVAGLGMMQVMMYGIAMYIGAFEDMDPALEQFLRYVSLVIATPVVFYAGAPFFQAAWRDVRARQPGMDVPVSIAIGGAYTASVWHTFAGTGEVYFDSVAMFVFFLLIGRFVEFTARHQVSETGQALAASLPATAERVMLDGNTASIPLSVMQTGDQVRVSHGSIAPADGRLLDDKATLDESLLSGESRSVERRRGDDINAGAINRGTPFVMQITRVGKDTLLSGITRLLEHAQTERPRLARFADRLARFFIGLILVAGSITAYAWWQLDPTRAFEITLSVLVVACPCALALAVPVALTAATSSLARQGLLTVNSDALENLNGITDVVFDKTGTLTTGKPRIRRTVVTGSLPEKQCLALAAGLEAQANHPIAAAFLQACEAPALLEAVEQVAGRGLAGVHGKRRYRIGTPDFALNDNSARNAPPGFEGSWVVLADEQGELAWFELEDAIRHDALLAIRQLRENGLALHLFSGDSESTVQEVAQRLHIEDHHARQRPEDKLARLRALQADGRRVLMIGDGINDAPVLAGADVSVAMARGAALAQSSADLVLNGSLTTLPALLERAALARRVMRQNLFWALGYNISAMPLAAMGLVPPWLAAIGMSASSLLVTLNALRLNRIGRKQTEASAPLASPRPATG